MSELLEHATRLFAERGYDGTTLQDIADAVGLGTDELGEILFAVGQHLFQQLRGVRRLSGR